MTEQEQKDIDALREAMKEEKVTCYSWLVSLSEMQPEQLKHSGFGGKTNAQAVLIGLDMSKKKIKRMLADHTRKYPDEGVRRS